MSTREYVAAVNAKNQNRPPRPSGRSTTRLFMITPPNTNAVILASHWSGKASYLGCWLLVALSRHHANLGLSADIPNTHTFVLTI